MPIKILKKTENPMASERFYQQRREALIDSGIPANMIDKFNATPNKLDASRILKKRKEKFKKAENPMADERFNAAFRSRMKKAGLKDSEIGDTRFKAGGLSGGQAKLAAKAPPPNKIDAKDFAVLRKEKAKGRGMGLQDEKVKPGKVMKAKTGKQIVKEFSASLKGIDESFKDKVHPMKKQRLMDRNKVIKAKYGKAVKTELKADPTKPISSVAPKASDILKKKKLPGRIGTALGIASMMVPAAYAAAIQYKDYKAAKNRDEAKVKKMVGGMAKKYSVGGGADMSKVKTKKKNILDKFTDKLNKAGEAYKKLGGAGLNVLRGNTKGQPFPAKKMGGGMMNKPMGYSSGSKLMDFIKSGSYTDKYGTKTNVDKAIKKINLSPKDKDLATMKPASDKKMMGGGMMQRPMGYKSGTMVKARGCKLGRTRPTKMY
jgi:hypothetical protein